MKLLKTLALLCLGFMFIWPCSAVCNQSTWQNDKLNISVFAHKTAQRNILVLVKFQMFNGWHIFWDNPGDAGVPVEFNWQFTENRRVERIHETTPQRFIYNDIITQFGYGDTAYYLFVIDKIPEDDKNFPKILLDVKWTACSDVCEPEETRLNVLPTNDTLWYTESKKARATFPEKVFQPVTAENDNYVLTLTFPSDEFDLHTEPFYFIPYERRLIAAEIPQEKLINKNNRLEIKAEANLEDFIPTKGILVYGSKAFVYDVVHHRHGVENNGSYSLWIVLLLAFVGGIILNCMPCVFPILSIKAFALAKSAAQNHHARRACSYFCGVVSSFLLMAFLLYLLRYGGAEAGWGFQLQSSWFVGAMLCLFILLFLLVADIIKIKGNFLDFFNQYAGVNSFMTGFLAVLIASPCTGPFMGAALGYALFQPPTVYFPVFLSLGIGYAIPFTLAEMYPTAIRKVLPKPGKWMIVLKKILSVPILLTCVWLGWILYHQTFLSPQQTDNSPWQPYDEKQIVRLIKSGKPVFIDFTAKWCVTCLANEKMALDTEEFLQIATKYGINLFKADWTSENPQISRALHWYNRSGVPLYVYYPPRQKATEQHPNYIVLPQLLTPDIVKKHLNIQDQDND